MTTTQKEEFFLIQSAQNSTGHRLVSCAFLEAPPGIGPGIEVLQTFALPLGHGVFCTM